MTIQIYQIKKECSTLASAIDFDDRFVVYFSRISRKAYFSIPEAAMEVLVPMFAFCLLLVGFGFSLIFIFYAAENYPDKYSTEINLILRSVAMFAYVVSSTALFVYASAKIFEPNFQITNTVCFLRPCLMFGALLTGLYWLKLHEKLESKEGERR